MNRIRRYFRGTNYIAFTHTVDASKLTAGFRTAGAKLIDWGDGQYDQITTSATVYMSHTYATAGTYRVKLFGKITDFCTYTSNMIYHSVIDDIDVAHAPALKGLFVVNGKLTTLDVSKNKALTSLWCSNNLLTSLDVSNNKLLVYLYCDNNKITDLRLSNLPGMMYLHCYGNGMNSLVLENLPALNLVKCYSNQLSTLDLSGAPAVETVWCNNNQLTSLIMNNNPGLSTLDCKINQLPSLDVSNAPNLKTLNCQSNQLTALDVNSNAALTSLYCDRNKITNLAIANLPELQLVHCYTNLLTSVRLENLPAMKTLYCYSNQLTELDITGMPNLVTLHCYANLLTNLITGYNPGLLELRCESNQFSTLDVSNCTNLASIAASNNPLVNPDFSDNPNLSVINLGGQTVGQTGNTMTGTLTLPTSKTVSELSVGGSSIHGVIKSSLTDIIGYEDQPFTIIRGFHQRNMAERSFDFGYLTNYDRITFGGIAHIKLPNKISDVRYDDPVAVADLKFFKIDSDTFEIMVDGGIIITDKLQYMQWLANYITVNNLHEYPQLNSISSALTANETKDLFDTVKVFMYDSYLRSSYDNKDYSIGTIWGSQRFTPAYSIAYNSSIVSFRCAITTKKDASFFIAVDSESPYYFDKGDRISFDNESIDTKGTASCSVPVDNGDGTVSFDVEFHTIPMLTSAKTTRFFQVYENKYPAETDPYASKIVSVTKI